MDKGKTKTAKRTSNKKGYNIIQQTINKVAKTFVCYNDENVEKPRWGLTMQTAAGRWRKKRFSEQNNSSVLVLKTSFLFLTALC